MNQKQKAPMDNVEEDKKELMPLLKKKLNLYKHSTIYSQLLAYFLPAFSTVAPPTILVDRYQFQSLSSLDAYIDTFEHGKE